MGFINESDQINRQVVLPFLPGYYWDGSNVKSTGASIEATQHVNPSNGEIRYYVKPVGWNCSAFIRHEGILDYLKKMSC